MSMKKTSCQSDRERGAVLIIALIFMLLTALVATTVMRTSIVEVKMVSNSQFKEEAFQKVESVVNNISADRNNFVVAGDVGFRNCASGSTTSGCSVSQISLPTAVATVPSGVGLGYHVDRKGPLVASLPFREDHSIASGANNFDVAFFEVVAEFDGRDEKLGHLEIWQGVAVKIAASHQ